MLTTGHALMSSMPFWCTLLNDCVGIYHSQVWVIFTISQLRLWIEKEHMHTWKMEYELWIHRIACAFGTSCSRWTDIITNHEHHIHRTITTSLSRCQLPHSRVVVKCSKYSFSICKWTKWRLRSCADNCRPRVPPSQSAVVDKLTCEQVPCSVIVKHWQSSPGWWSTRDIAICRIYKSLVCSRHTWSREQIKFATIITTPSTCNECKSVSEYYEEMNAWIRYCPPVVDH